MNEDDLSSSLCALTTVDNTVDSVHLTVDTGSSSEEAVCDAHIARRRKLNAFLEECNVMPLNQKPMLPWEEASERTRERYVARTSEIITAVLNTVSEENAACLWNALQSARSISAALGIDTTTHPSENAYLEALVEAYKNMSGWDTKRQVLSVMSGVASFAAIKKFIPELSRYRYHMATTHSLQYGRGVAVPKNSNPRMRVDRRQLDHFINFITSGHLIQDLPFGEKRLKLTSGKEIKVPNIIRTMIPQRIAEQYTAFCQETEFVPFSKRTMLRVLSECSASVRKSLQGLDNYAAEGAHAFDDLAGIVENISTNVELDAKKTEILDALKAGKLYLKGEYKVSGYMKLCLICNIAGNMTVSCYSGTHQQQ